ncbi:Diphosphomevalonate decarboxylase [Schistosoma japonicum]|nr:Diphosphomevalonate decarboxylase [Schistosoma japonicum]
MQVQVTCPVNIALLKYWGKVDELNIFPLTSSISLTLNQSHVGSRTTVFTKNGLKQSQFKLNGRVTQFPPRLLDVLIIAQLRSRLHGKHIASPFICVETENNFPTAAGLASSASGTAAFAFALGKMYSLDGDYTSFSRRGSGSSCRSLSGGFVLWSSNRGDYLHPSFVQQLFPSSHWPELKVLICVVNEHSKHIGSTDAMLNCVNTSDLFRSGRVLSAKIHEKQAISALRERDFSALAEVTMRESNQLHAVCLDTWPPCVFLNHLSYSIMDFVHRINKYFKKSVVAYTFDAGPNAFLLTESHNIENILKYLVECFGRTVGVGDSMNTTDKFTVQCRDSNKYLKVIGIRYSLSDTPLDQNLLGELPCIPGGIQYLISTENFIIGK